MRCLPGVGDGVDVREVDRAGRRARVHELDERRAHFAADGLLRLGRGAADVRRQDDVRQALQRRREAVAVRLRLLGEDVDRRAAEVPALQRLGQRRDVDHRAAARVEQAAALLHRRELVASPIIPRVCGVSGTCSVTKSLSREELVERARRAVVAHRAAWPRRRRRARACRAPRRARPPAGRCARSRRCRAFCRGPRS